MTGYILRRLMITLLTLLGVSMLVFLLVHVLPGDIIDTKLSIFAERSPALIAEMEARYGLDQPLPVQYLRWLSSMLRGNLGTSWRNREPISRLIAESLPITVELTALSMFITVVIGVPLGLLSAIKRNSLF